MEYTKDMILKVNYGQASRKQKNRWNIFDKLLNIFVKHRFMTIIVSITFMLMILDFMLISSFINVLSGI